MTQEIKNPAWRERMKALGKEAFTLEEMMRLGFWLPADDPQAEQTRIAALEALKVKGVELADLRAELSKVEETIRTATDTKGTLKIIRKRRIEESKARREERRLARLQAQEERRLADQDRRRETPPYLGEGVSAGLRFEGGDSEKVAALGLPTLNTASDIARAIGLDEKELRWLTYHRGAATIDHYHRFMIPKRKGGQRVISSPKRRLRVAQAWLLGKLLNFLPVHDAAMAFRAGRSIVENALQHQNRAIVIRMDLKDFFPSINFRRVKGLFQSFGYNEGVASILGLIATEAPRLAITLDGGTTRYVSTGRRQLPQGACTSPAITNLLCVNLDKRLEGLAKSFEFIYTRYADDLVFSTARPEATLGAFLKIVRRILKSEGFTVNEEKTLVMRPQHRQVITGVVVNNAVPALSRRDLRQYRAFLHQCETKGLEAISEKIGKNALYYASGYLSFIKMVSPEKAAQLQNAHPWLAKGKI